MRRLTTLGLALAAAVICAAPARAQMDPFHWIDGATASITTGNASANVALLKMPSGKTQVRIVSTCATVEFVRKGADNTVTAAATDFPVAPNSVEVLTLENLPTAPVTYLAMISPAGSCTLYITTGLGT